MRTLSRQPGRALVASGDGEIDWPTLMNGLPTGADETEALGEAFADLEIWPSDQLTVLVTEIIPAYAVELARLADNPDDRGEGQTFSSLSEEAARLNRIAEAATAALTGRSEAEEAARAEFDANLGSLGQFTQQEPTGNDPAGGGDEPSGDDPGDSDEPTGGGDEPTGDDPGAGDDPAGGGGTGFAFGQVPERVPVGAGAMNSIAGGTQTSSDPTGDTPTSGAPGTNSFGISQSGTGPGTYSHYEGFSFSGVLPTHEARNLLSADDTAQLAEGGAYRDVNQLSRLIARQLNRSGHRTAARPTDPVNRAFNKQQLAVAHTQFGTTITEEMGFAEQFEIIRSVRQDARQNPALVAAATEGCTIPPFTPRRQFIRCAERFSPVRSSIPAINVAGEGGLKWMRPPSWNAAKAGIQITTAMQNAQGYGAPAVLDEQGNVISESTIPPGGAPFKPCMRMPCPTWYEACVDALSVCVIFDNLQKRVWPELVQNFLMDVEIAVDAVLEQYILSTIDEQSEPVIGLENQYGAVRTLLTDGITMRRRLIEREHMPETTVVNWYLPAWSLDQLAIDMLNSDRVGIDFLMNMTTESIVAAIRSKFRINIITYRDEAVNCEGESTGQRLNTLHVDSANNNYALAPLPRYPVSYMFEPGTWAILDGGQWETGIYWDSILNSTNDCALFQELWIETVRLGCASLKGVHDICPSGAGVAGIANPFDCSNVANVSQADFSSSVGSLYLQRADGTCQIHVPA